MFTIGTFGIIMDEKERVLLSHRRDLDLWNLPGGKVEANESPWDAVIREIKEETGLDTRIIHLSGVYSKPDKNEIVFSFTCEITCGEITLTDEADEIKYFGLEQFPKNTSPKQVERIRDYFADQSKTHYKIQTGPSSADLVKQGKL
ncbi:MAG: NUDIX hydrolase [Patescibacteria group bacterium]